MSRKIIGTCLFLPMTLLAASSVHIDSSIRALAKYKMSSMDTREAYICLSTERADEYSNKVKLVKEYVSNRRVFVFDPNKYTWAAYKDGVLVKTGRASGGAKWCADVKRPCKTPQGRFRIYSLGAASCKSSKYPLEKGGGAPMPHCMHFLGGYAIHGSPHVPLHNASHGCIRVTPQDAKWLRHNFMTIGTEVKVRAY